MNDRALATAAVAMKDVDELALGAEHTRLARHVAGVEATAYQIGKYVDFHRRRQVEPLNDFDRFLLRLSNSSALGLSLSDAYTGTLYRSGIVRVKLMVTLAILECSPPSYVVLDKPDGGWVYLAMVLRIALAVLALGAAVLVIAPVHVLYAATGRARRERPCVVT
jgi:hypothetical protein